MKTILTTEQSRHLIDLRVSKEKASKVAWAQIRKFSGNEIPENEQRKGVSDKPFSAWHVGFESFSTDDIFALDDFLNGEILPKEIEYDGYTYKLTMTCGNKCEVGYVTEKIYNLGTYINKELIDALYELTCWYYGEFMPKKMKNRKEI